MTSSTERRHQPRGDLYLDQRFVLPDGSLVGYEYFDGDATRTTRTATRGIPMFSLVIPGERYRFVEAREAARARRRHRSSSLLAGRRSSSRGGDPG